jgi:hypothetical protein
LGLRGEVNGEGEGNDEEDEEGEEEMGRMGRMLWGGRKRRFRRGRIGRVRKKEDKEGWKRDGIPPSYWGENVEHRTFNIQWWMRGEEEDVSTDRHRWKPRRAEKK